VFVRRVRPAFVIGAGLLLAGVGYALLTQVGGAASLATIMVANIVTGAGFGLIFTLTSTLIVSAAPPERAGAASALSETAAEFGGASGIAILGALGTAVYRNVMASSIPAAVPPAAAEVARDTLGGAVVVAGQLPGPLGVALLDAARGAFSEGLYLTAAIAAVVMTAAAILAAVLLRHADIGVELAGQEPDGMAAGIEGMEPVLVPVETAENP
jgi:DHA2 family multidrug resistance protein-like MFS transporter